MCSRANEKKNDTRKVNTLASSIQKCNSLNAHTLNTYEIDELEFNEHCSNRGETREEKIL